jgi:hypothetical protein
MQHLPPFLSYFWLAGIAFQMILTGVIVAKSVWKRLPVFAVYCWTNLVASIGLYSIRAMHASGYVYFYTYWISECISVLLGFGILYGIFQELLESQPALRRVAAMVFRWVLIVLLLLATVLIFMQSSEKQSPLVTAVIIMEQGIRVVEVGLIMFLFLFSRAFGLHWRHQIFGVVLGLGVFTSVELAGLTVFAHLGAVATSAFAAVRSLAFDVSLLVWIGYILAPEPVTTGELPQREQLEQWNKAVMEFMHQ